MFIIIVHDLFLLQANSCNNNCSRPIRLIFFNIQNNPYLKVKLTCFASISINLSQHHSHGLSTIILLYPSLLLTNLNEQKCKRTHLRRNTRHNGGCCFIRFFDIYNTSCKIVLCRSIFSQLRFDGP